MVRKNGDQIPDLRERLSGLQRSLLNFIWQHFIEKGEWISTKALHHKFGKPAVLEALTGLGGSIAFEISERTGKERYHLTLLGVLLTSEGSSAEDLLARYLEHLRRRFEADPDVESVTSNEVGAALNLTPENARVLGCLIDLGRLWGNTSTGLGKDDNWSAGVQIDIDDLPYVPDLAAYVKSRALEGFDPNLPVAQSERMRYLVIREHGEMSNEVPDRPFEESTPVTQREQAETETGRWDCFICHASEDKHEVVEPLAKALKARGLSVWYDRWVLEIGDSLRRKIDEGLRESRFGVVVLSPAFFEKEWPQRELDGLVQKEVAGRKVVLPIWHKVRREDVAAFSPTLADKIAGETLVGVTALAAQLSVAMGRTPLRPERTARTSMPSESREMLVSSDDEILDQQSVLAEAIRALRLGRMDAAARARDFMESLAKALGPLKPCLVKGDEDELLVQALSQSVHGVSEFGTVAKSVAEMASEEGAVSLFCGLKWILDGYNLPRGFSGQFLRTQFDYHKFLGHELCTMLFQCLLLDRRWEIISRLLGEGIHVENAGAGRHDVVGLEFISQHAELLDLRGHRTRLRPGWVRSQLLAERHTSGDLGLVSPIEGFVDADFLLLLASRGYRGVFGDQVLWRPWSICLAKGVPRFLLEAYRTRQAEILRQVVRANDLDTLRARTKERLEEAGRFVGGLGFHLFDGFDLARIGTE